MNVDGLGTWPMRLRVVGVALYFTGVIVVLVQSRSYEIATLMAFGAYVAVGGLIAVRRPGNLIGLALEEARFALAHDDVPIGAVVVGADGVVLAARHNERELSGDPCAHAEMLALRDAAERLGRWRLDNCTLAITLEPCVMCAGAAQQTRIGRVVYGAMDEKAGALGSLYNVGVDPRFPHQYEVTMRVRADECAALLTGFFEARR